MLSDTLGVSLVGNLLTGKGTIRASKGTIRPIEGTEQARIFTAALSFN